MHLKFNQERSDHAALPPRLLPECGGRRWVFFDVNVRMKSRVRDRNFPLLPAAAFSPWHRKFVLGLTLHIFPAEKPP